MLFCPLSRLHLQPRPRQAIVVLLLLASHSDLSALELLRLEPDPYGYPRPFPGQVHVPTSSTLYFELKASTSADSVLTPSLRLTLRESENSEQVLLASGRPATPQTHARVWESHNWRANSRTVSVYVSPGQPLRPGTLYTATVQARTRNGETLSAPSGSWTFTTEAETTQPHHLSFALDLRSPAVAWSGGFFTGWCKPGFCTSRAYSRIPTYELMKSLQQKHGRAWSLQRDWHPTGGEAGGAPLPMFQPNVVRELETRRITSVRETTHGFALQVEDFFGCDQYGIPPGRSVALDYRPGDEVLIADPDRSSTATVLRVDAAKRTVFVAGLPVEPGWKLEYTAPLPLQGHPDVPGIFPAGGCYLLKSRPAGTPRYFWKRLDAELDLVVGQYGRRQVLSLCEAPGDLSRDGRPGNTAKDLVQFHAAVREITGHLIDRYGQRCLEWTWSILNEPDIGFLFFRAEREEMERFYDYASDAVLRAFEDRGYDSEQVFIGGLELGLLPMSQSWLERFLAHCSPTAAHPEALPKNAAFADPRLDGKRARRTETLCRKSGGKGAPLDFVSVHCYNGAEKTAGKLEQAKRLALQIDPETYRGLHINSHEACPDWAPPEDPAASDSYLGNGYFETWCTDVVRRQLAAASRDPRYAFGETILTFWPWPSANFRGAADAFHVISCDVDGDGNPDSTSTIALSAAHVISTLSGYGKNCLVLPETHIQGQTVSGFAGRSGAGWHVVLYAHQEKDLESASNFRCTATLLFKGLSPGAAEIISERIDRDEGSLCPRLREAALSNSELLPPRTYETLKALSRRLPTNHTATEVAADGSLEISVKLRSNTAALLTIRPAEE